MQSTLPPSSQRSAHGWIGTVGSLIVTAGLLGASAYIFTHRQYLLDSFHFWEFQPSQQIVTIAQRAGLNDTGTFDFYAARPEIDDSQTFNNHCNQSEQNTAILGCYTGEKIYIYNVTNPQLDGIQEVTAAHEMLHAVYERMSDSERASVNELVEAEYKKLQSDPSYAERMAYYARTEPGDRDNELHSIIGTEVRNISPELEQHYAQYFSDRSKVVTLHENYNSAFTALDTQSKQLAAQLDNLSKQISSDLATYNGHVKQLNVDIDSFNQRAASGGFTNQSEFTAQRQALVTRANSVSSEREAINTEITKYNKLKDQYNAIVTQSQKLYESIDSNLAPAPTVQ